jgi:hypothetical protein
VSIQIYLTGTRVWLSRSERRASGIPRPPIENGRIGNLAIANDLQRLADPDSVAIVLIINAVQPIR